MSVWAVLLVSVLCVSLDSVFVVSLDSVLVVLLVSVPIVSLVLALVVILVVVSEGSVEALVEADDCKFVVACMEAAELGIVEDPFVASEMEFPIELDLKLPS